MRIADAALSLTLGPSTARLEISAAASGRSTVHAFFDRYAAALLGPYGGRAQERFCYQLVEGTDGYRIAVLTPMG